MSKGIYVILALPLLIGACQSRQAAAIAAAQEVVARNLTDPASAQFRDVKYYRDGAAICGEVNAKNRLGGYVGFQRFFVVAGTATMEPAPELEIKDIERLRNVTESGRFNLRHMAVCSDLPDDLRPSYPP